MALTVANKIHNKQIKNAAEMKQINLISRVDRSELVSFFQNRFASLDGVSDAELKSKRNRVTNAITGWVVPVSCYGRNADNGATVTMAESIRGWINLHLSDYIPADSKVAVCFEDWHSDAPQIVVYRKVWK